MTLEDNSRDSLQRKVTGVESCTYRRCAPQTSNSTSRFPAVLQHLTSPSASGLQGSWIKSLSGCKVQADYLVEMIDRACVERTARYSAYFPTPEAFFNCTEEERHDNFC